MSKENRQCLRRDRRVRLLESEEKRVRRKYEFEKENPSTTLTQATH